MVRAFYDESGEYDENGRLLNMTVGGCVSTLEKWKVFEVEWRRVLDNEELPSFHMAKFEGWVPPFDFKLENGERDWDRHKRVLNSLLDIVLSHVEGLYGFGAITVSIHPGKAHGLAIEDCVSHALKHAYLEVWDNYQRPISLVFDRSNHISPDHIQRLASVWDWGDARGRVKDIKPGNSAETLPLQAADIFAYEVARAQRSLDRNRYPYRRMVEAAEGGRIKMAVGWRVTQQSASRGQLVGQREGA